MVLEQDRQVQGVQEVRQEVELDAKEEPFQEEQQEAAEAVEAAEAAEAVEAAEQA